jgi:hypothetical protein
MSVSPAAITEEFGTRLAASPSFFVEQGLGVSPFEYQRELLNSTRDRRCFVSGRQVGKSRVCAWIALHAALTRSETVLITAPTQRQSSELFDQIKREMTGSIFGGSHWGIDRETRTTIEMKGGSRIICLPTGTDGKTIRGYTADLIIVDEAAFIDRQIFSDVLEPMLATTNGTLILASTPFGTSGYLYDAAHRGEWDTVQVPMSASPLIDEAYIERQRETKSQTTFRQEVLGEFVESADAFFNTELVTGCLSEPAAIEQTTPECYLGVDLARHGTDASVFVSMDAAGTVFHTEQTRDKPLTDGIGRVRRLHDEHAYSTIAIDETGLGAGVVDTLAEDIREIEGVTFTIDRKQSLYNGLKSAMESGDITLPAVPHLRQQLADMQYELTSGGKTKIHHPEGGADDWPDALVLAHYARTALSPTRHKTRRRRGGEKGRRTIRR